MVSVQNTVYATIEEQKSRSKQLREIIAKYELKDQLTQYFASKERMQFRRNAKIIICRQARPQQVQDRIWIMKNIRIQGLGYDLEKGEIFFECTIEGEDQKIALSTTEKSFILEFKN